MPTSALPLGAMLCTRCGQFSLLLSDCADADLSKSHITSELPGCDSLEVGISGQIDGLCMKGLHA